MESGSFYAIPCPRLRNSDLPQRVADGGAVAWLLLCGGGRDRGARRQAEQWMTQDGPLLQVDVQLPRLSRSPPDAPRGLARCM